MLTLVAAVEVVVFVLDDWLDVVVDLIVVFLESGLGRTSLLGLGLLLPTSYIDFLFWIEASPVRGRVVSL